MALDASLRPAGPLAWSDLTHDTRRAVADGMLHPEVRRLARELRGLRSAPQARVSKPRPSTPSPSSSRTSPSTAPTSRSAPSTSPAAVAAAAAVAPTSPAPSPSSRACSATRAHPAAIRFQQTSGMVMAKGVEDTAFYRDSRLATLTEVGGDPDHFATTVASSMPRRPHASPLTRTV